MGWVSFPGMWETRFTTLAAGANPWVYPRFEMSFTIEAVKIPTAERFSAISRRSRGAPPVTIAARIRPTAAGSKRIVL